jgi:hypothetical protein
LLSPKLKFWESLTIKTNPPYDNLRNYKGYSFEFERIAEGLFKVVKKSGVVVWVVCKQGKGYLFRNNIQEKIETNFDRDSVGLIKENRGDNFLVWLIGNDNDFIIPKTFFSGFGVMQVCLFQNCIYLHCHTNNA